MRLTATAKAQVLIIILPMLILAALIATNVENLPAPLPLLRSLLALSLMLFIPGYALQSALFPARAALDGPQRLALSIGLSIVIIPPVALVLDKVSFGLRVWPVVLSWALLSIAFLAMAWYRGRRLAPDERFLGAFRLDLARRWSFQSRTVNLLCGLLFLVLLAAVVSGLVIAAIPKSGDAFTEFYVLGSGNLAESYLQEAIIGHPVTVTIGITNWEGVQAEYRVTAVENGIIIGDLGPVRLETGVNDQRSLSFAPAETGEDVKIEFFLHRAGKADPYRTLRLLLRVVDKDGGTTS